MKHWRSSTKVGSSAIKDFLNVIVEENLNAGLFLSTYGYTSNAFEAVSEIERHWIRFGQKEKVVSLCKTYVDTESGLVVSPDLLPTVLFNETITGFPVTSANWKKCGGLKEWGFGQPLSSNFGRIRRNMSMQMERRALYIPVFHIDANLINARQKLPEVNQLESWFRDGVIMINISGTARQEAMAGGNGTRTRKVNQHIYTATPAGDSSDARYSKIECALFPDGPKNNNQQNDVKIVFEAAKYAAILVTGDGGSKRQPWGILGNRLKLKDIVQILNPSEAVAFVKKKIKERDEFNIRVAKEFGGQLPEWTGID